LNAVFAEALEMDIERLERINRTLSLIPESVRCGGLTEPGGHTADLRTIPLFVLRPSCDLGDLAKDTLKSFPPMLQYLFRGLGISSRTGFDLLSYLAFDFTYTSKLLDLGYRDAMAVRHALLEFVTHP
jgi:NTE family protein